jgi:hypothetical protein
MILFLDMEYSYVAMLYTPAHAGVRRLRKFLENDHMALMACNHGTELATPPDFRKKLRFSPS